MMRAEWGAGSGVEGERKGGKKNVLVRWWEDRHALNKMFYQAPTKNPDATANTGHYIGTARAPNNARSRASSIIGEFSIDVFRFILFSFFFFIFARLT